MLPIISELFKKNKKQLINYINDNKRVYVYQRA